MASIIVNGRQLDYNGSGIRGRDIISNLPPDSGRRPVIRSKGMEFEEVNPDKWYDEKELKDKNGAPVKVSSIPDRTKGVEFGLPRDIRSKSIIKDQVYDIAANLFKDGIDFDERNTDWMVVNRYRMPRIWQVREARLMILFPSAYPEMPPIGFYIDSHVTSPNGHLFPQAHHGASAAPTMKGWKWYCAFVNGGAWQPAYIRNLNDWRRGDNLWTYMTLVNEVLAGHGA